MSGTTARAVLERLDARSRVGASSGLQRARADLARALEASNVTALRKALAAGLRALSLEPDPPGNERNGAA